MTVKELKEKLEEFDENLEIIRSDNSGGCEKIYSIYSSEVRDNFNKNNNKIAIILD